MKRAKKALALFLALVMCVGLMPTVAFAGGQSKQVGIKMANITAGTDGTYHLAPPNDSDEIQVANNVTVTMDGTELTVSAPSATDENATLYDATGKTITVTAKAGYYIKYVMVGCNDDSERGDEVKYNTEKYYGYGCQTATGGNAARAIGAVGTTTVTLTASATGKEFFHGGRGSPYWILICLGKSPNPAYVRYEAGDANSYLNDGQKIVSTTVNDGDSGVYQESTSHDVQFKYAYTEGTTVPQHSVLVPTVTQYNNGGNWYKFIGWHVTCYDGTESEPFKELLEHSYDLAYNDGTFTVQDSSDSQITMNTNVRLVAQWRETSTPTTANYKVEHYQQNLNDNSYTLKDTENLTGTVNTNVTATQKSYDGFTCDTSVTGTLTVGTVTADGSLTLKLYYTRNTHTVNYQYSGSAPSGASVLPDNGTYKYGATVTVADAATAAGYTFSGWSAAGVAVTDGTFTMPDQDVTLTGSFTANTGTQYKVEHYQQNLNDSGYTHIVTDDKTESGVTGEQTNAQAKTYTGFTAKEFAQKTIAGDGSTVVQIYYDRNTYTVTYTDGVADATVFEDQTNNNVRYGASTPSFTGSAGNTPTRNGYVFAGWNPEVAQTVTGNATYIAQWEKDEWKDGKNTDPDSETGGDGIPDSQQALIKYASANANQGSVAPTIQVETLTANGGTYTGTAVLNSQATANTDYAFDYWEGPGIAATKTYNAQLTETLSVTGGQTYTYTANFDEDVKGKTDPSTGDIIGDGTPDKYQAFVEFKSKGNGSVAGTGIRQTTTFRDHAESGSVTPSLDNVTVTADKGYAFDIWTKNSDSESVEPTDTMSSVQGGTTITFYANFAVDILVDTTVPGQSDPDDPDDPDDPTDPTDGDGIPDKYQVQMTFEVKNGSWNDGTTNDVFTVVTLKDTNGNNSENGNASLTTPEVGNKPATGYMAGGWDETPPKSVSKSTSKTTYTYTYVNAYTVTYTDGVDGEEVFADQKYEQLSKDYATPKFKVNGTEADPTRSGYVFAGWDKEIAATVTADATYTAQWDEDTLVDPTVDPDPNAPGDGVADKYQVQVTFKVVNGKWNDETTNDVVTVVTLKDTNGDNSENGNASLTTPEVGNKPATGYMAGGWDETPPKSVSKSTSKTTYTYTYVNAYTVTYTDGVDGEEVFADQKYEKLSKDYATPKFKVNGTEADPTRSGYVFAGWNPAVANTVTGDVTYTAQWDADTLVDPTVPETERPTGGGDGIPDKYQVTVTYTATNGSVSLDSTVVTLVDENGNPAENGTGHLTAAQIPTATPNSGYTGAAWTPASPTTTVAITGDKTFHVTWSPRSSGTSSRPSTPPASGSDTDLPDEDVPLAEVPGLNSVDHYAYLIGRSDGTIAPGAKITRAEVATIFFRLMTDEFRTENWATTSDLTDLNSGLWYNNATCTAVKAGIILGRTDGQFHGGDYITRAEFAAIAARFLSEPYDGPNMFADIDGHWAAEEINRATRAGWFMGAENFRPNDDITRAEVVTIVNRMLDRVPDADQMLEDMITWPDNQDKTAWYYADIQEATNSHDYERADLFTAETWTQLLENRDWAALEKEWATAGSAPGGEVMTPSSNGSADESTDDASGL